MKSMDTYTDTWGRMIKFLEIKKFTQKKTWCIQFFQILNAYNMKA